MRLFRRVPTPFAITYLVSSLLRESVQKRKADKYAAQAVHYYKLCTFGVVQGSLFAMFSASVKFFVSLCYNYRHRARSANRSEKFSCTARKTEKRTGAVALARRPAVR